MKLDNPLGYLNTGLRRAGFFIVPLQQAGLFCLLGDDCGPFPDARQPLVDN